MGKRSDFPRRPHDSYQTPYEAVSPLLPHLDDIDTFAEPCAGHGLLVKHLTRLGKECVYAGDILDGQDALTLTRADIDHAEAVITNPPWTRQLLHPLIAHFVSLAPTWLLLDADWAHNQHAAPYLPYCVKIVSVGRVKWFGTAAGKDNVAWFYFHPRHETGPRFYGRELEEAA